MDLDHHWKKIIGQMQPLKPGSVDEYVTSQAGVFFVKGSFDFSGFDHIHRGFEFIVPFGPTAPYRIGGRTLVTEHMKIFPFNPEQEHRTVDPVCGPGLLAIFFETEFLEGLSRSISNVGSLRFTNRSSPFSQHLKYLVDCFRSEIACQKPGFQMTVESLAMQIGIHLLRHAENNSVKSSPVATGAHKRAVSEAIDFIHENYRSDFSLTELADAVHLSAFHLSRQFKAETGQPPFAFLNSVKLEKAKELLRSSDMSITAICHESGFNNVSHFSRVFSKCVGMPPTAFRRMMI